MPTVKGCSRARLCFLLSASQRLTFSLASDFRVLRVHFHGFRLFFWLILLCWLCNLDLRVLRGCTRQDLDCLLPSNEVLRYQVLKKPLKESLMIPEYWGGHQESFQMIGCRGLICFVGSNYKCIFVGFLSLLQCCLGCTFSPRACIESVAFPAKETFDCLVPDRVVI